MKKEVKKQSIIFPTPVLIVGTYNEDGSANAMNAAWGGVCASEPPAIMVAIRKARKTYENIIKRNSFTVNIPNKELMEVADFFGICSGKNVDKFKYAGVNPVKSELVDAPHIGEFPVSAECKLINSMEVGSHVLFVGEIVRLIADESVVDHNNVIDVEKVGALGYDPAGSNYTLTSEIVGKAFSAGLPILERTK